MHSVFSALITICHWTVVVVAAGGMDLPIIADVRSRRIRPQSLRKEMTSHGFRHRMGIWWAEQPKMFLSIFVVGGAPDQHVVQVVRVVPTCQYSCRMAECPAARS